MINVPLYVQSSVVHAPSSMKSAIYKENVLPNAMIRDVLVANPQSAKSSEILDKVNERMDPMPEEMMDEILEGQNIHGNLEVLRSKLGLHTTHKYVSLNKLESYYKQDTLNFQASQDSLISLWSSESDPEILYKLAFIYLDNIDSINCFNTLNSIPQLPNLTDKQLAEYDDYSLLMNILWSINRDPGSLDSNKAEQLAGILSGNRKPGYLARNVLVANGILNYSEPIYLAEEFKLAEADPDKSKNLIRKNSYLSVFPNPASDYIIVSYNLESTAGKSNIRIISLDGKPYYSKDLTGKTNQTILSLSGFSAGAYSIHLISNGEILESCKFVITK